MLISKFLFKEEKVERYEGCKPPKSPKGDFDFVEKYKLIHLIQIIDALVLIFFSWDII
jgi:hypothetical protein